MKLKQNKNSQINFVFIIFGLFILSFVLYSIRERSTSQLQEGLKIKKALKKVGKKIKKEAESFATGLFVMLLCLVLAGALIFVLSFFVYVVFIYTQQQVLSIS